jgi:hypothetical protein
MRRRGSSQFGKCKRKKEIKKQNIIERRRKEEKKKKEIGVKTCVKWIEVTEAVNIWLDLEESRDSRKRTI